MRLVIAALATLLALAGCSGDGPGDTATSVTGPRDGVTASTFSLVDGADAVVVRTADVGDDLYRISTPQDSRVRPQVTVDGGVVHLHLTHRDGPGPADVDVLLSRAVRWRVEARAGTGSFTADLRGGAVAGVDVLAGSGRVDLALPPPHGTVPVRMVGGTSSWTVTRPADVPVRATASAGAGSIAVDDVSRVGVAAGTVLASPGWQAAADRYDLDAVGGVAALVVTAAGGATSTATASATASA